MQVSMISLHHIPLAKLIQSTDEDDNVPLAELVTQLQRSTASEQTIQIEEFVGIDDSVRKYTHPLSKLTSEQRWFYEDNGYILIKNNVDHALLDKCRQRFVDICEAEPGAYNALVNKDPFLKTKGAKGQYVVNKIQYFHEDDVLWEYISNKNVVDVVENIIGPNITATNAMLINKPPDSTKDFSIHPLHQDLYYFPFRPADGIVASWTAMERIDERNGCLYVIPGSHSKGILYKHEYPKGLQKHALYHGVQGMDHLPRLNVPMEKGDTIFFHPLLLHGSGPNLTKGFRKAIACHYADTNSHFIDVRGTTQDQISKEILNIAKKRGVTMSFTEVWKLNSRLVRGPPGNFQTFDSHL